MIVSLEREEDKEVAKNILEILETVASSYQRTGSQELLTHIEKLSAWYDTMVEKIKHSDYTEADARRVRVDKILQKLNGYSN